MAAGIPEFAVRKSQAVRDRHVESFQMALRLGVTIAAGTDAGTPLNPHGSLVPELALMVKAGLAPLAAIHAATASAAARARARAGDGACGAGAGRGSAGRGRQSRPTASRPSTRCGS